MTIPLTAHAASLPETVPFVGPEAQERARGMPFAARLGANESAFGPAPEVTAAIAASAADCWQYGDPEMVALRAPERWSLISTPTRRMTVNPMIKESFCSRFT